MFSKEKLLRSIETPPAATSEAMLGSATGATGHENDTFGRLKALFPAAYHSISTARLLDPPACNLRHNSKH